MSGFFHPRPALSPTIYAYSVRDPEFDGLLKVGYTTRDAYTRVKEQFPIKSPGRELFKIVVEQSAVRDDGSVFIDRDVHSVLRRYGIQNPKGSEWFKCTIKDVRAAILEVKNGQRNIERRSVSYSMRPEQQRAVNMTASYFLKNAGASGEKLKFLWNAKMRFGKTFAAYQLAKKMSWKKVLVMTFKPAVEAAWREDIENHIDFDGWKFLSPSLRLPQNFHSKESDPVVCFGSFQDFLGKNKVGGIKVRNEWVHLIDWDCIILDEYHFGAWRESAKELFASEDREEQIFADGAGRDYFDQDILPINSRHFLYLSGTPFKAIARGEFIEEQIFNWTYADEQAAKKNWQGGGNPYISLPRLVLLTYQPSTFMLEVASRGEVNEFDLNEFFAATGEGDSAEFRYPDHVQRWLDYLRAGDHSEEEKAIKRKAEIEPMPFANAQMRENLTHCFWFLPSIASCYAMRNLLLRRANSFYQEYAVVVAAGNAAGIGVAALGPVKDAIGDPLRSKTITLSCGKLTTGVSVPAWSAIFMLRNTTSAETYFQAAFRVQTPWTQPSESLDGSEIIMKSECYVFDFAPNRALRLVSEYSCNLNVSSISPEKKIQEFIQYLPILAYDGSYMKELDATGVLDLAISGTTATLLARKWEDNALINTDIDTLEKLFANQEVMAALMGVEGYRNLNKDLEIVINKNTRIKNLKRTSSNTDLTDEQTNQLKQDEKEFRSKRKEIQNKLKHLISRLPLFMYLSDYRERALVDVIADLEPELFYRVTGISTKIFKALLMLGLFNEKLMDDAVFKFKRYEDPSFEYGDVKVEMSEQIGLWSVVISKDVFQNSDRLFESDSK